MGWARMGSRQLQPREPQETLLIGSGAVLRLWRDRRPIEDPSILTLANEGDAPHPTVHTPYSVARLARRPDSCVTKKRRGLFPGSPDAAQFARL